jgi:hypothetical protein
VEASNRWELALKPLYELGGDKVRLNKEEEKEKEADGGWSIGQTVGKVWVPSELKRDGKAQRRRENRVGL